MVDTWGFHNRATPLGSTAYSATRSSPVRLRHGMAALYA